MPDKQQFYSLQIEGLSSELRVVRFRGTEGISELFEFEVDFVSDDPAIDFEGTVGKPALLEMQTNDDPRCVHGIVASIEEYGVGPKFTNYSVTIVPALWTFGLRKDSCIYQAMNVPDVIKDILTSGGFSSGSDFELRLAAGYPKLEYCVQYRESDLEFVTRLMEETGIFYFFEHTSDGHLLVLADDPGKHADIAGNAVLDFRAVDTGMQSDKEEVSALRYSRSLRTGSVAMRSFNFEKTALTLETTSKADADADYVDYDYDGRYVAEGAGKDLAKIRQESYAVTRRVLTGSSNCRHLTAGYKFGVQEHPRDEFNSDFVLVRVKHAGEQPQAAGADAMGAGAGQRAYVNAFEAIPADVPFRPAQTTERGLVEGPQTATVTGPAGEEIHCDAHGRVKVKFHWDRYGKADDKASVWIRVAQSHRLGDIAIPRIGEEVIVDFLEGDPDQPIITGHVYNGTRPFPYSLPGDKTKSSFKTYSSPGGGGFNELRFEDASGSEEVFMHAQKDMNVKTLHDKTEDIGNDYTHNVGHDETREVKHDRFRKVGNNEAVDIAKDQLIKIGADRTEAVAGNESVKIDKNLTHEAVGTRSETTGKERTTSVGAKDTLSVGDDQEVSVGAGQSISVKKDYSLSVDGDISVETKGKHETSSDGKYGVDAKKDVEIKSGKKIKIEGTNEIKLECGSASITLKKSGDIEIKGKKIDMKADGDIQIKGSKISEN